MREPSTSSLKEVSALFEVFAQLAHLTASAPHVTYKNIKFYNLHGAEARKKKQPKKPELFSPAKSLRLFTVSEIISTWKTNRLKMPLCMAD